MDNEERLANALKELHGLCPHHLLCESFHHEKKDRHGYDEPCPLEERYQNALKEASLLLRKYYGD